MRYLPGGNGGSAQWVPLRAHSCQVITHLGEVLEKAFSPRPDDEDELENRVTRA